MADPDEIQRCIDGMRRAALPRARAEDELANPLAAPAIHGRRRERTVARHAEPCSSVTVGVLLSTVVATGWCLYQRVLGGEEAGHSQCPTPRLMDN